MTEHGGGTPDNPSSQPSREIHIPQIREINANTLRRVVLDSLPLAEEYRDFFGIHGESEIMAPRVRRDESATVRASKDEIKLVWTKKLSDGRVQKESASISTAVHGSTYAYSSWEERKGITDETTKKSAVDNDEAMVGIRGIINKSFLQPDLEQHSQ